MKEESLIKFHAINENDTKKFAHESFKYFVSGNTVLLYGDLGSGKTHLTKLYCKLFGIKLDVTSPSFSIINQYHGDVIINHIDFYRVKNKKELLNLGLDDILYMENSITFIEWPGIIEPNIIWKHYRIYIEFIKNNSKGRIFKLFEVN